jgi:hypothetical protein
MEMDEQTVETQVVEDRIPLTKDQASSEMLAHPIVEYFLTLTLSEGWKKLEIDDQVDFRTRLSAFVAVANKAREVFDKAVWKGHEDGTVSPDVIKSVRVRPDGEKPGRKAVEKTMAQIIAESMK